MAFVIN